MGLPSCFVFWGCVEGDKFPAWDPLMSSPYALTADLPSSNNPKLSLLHPKRFPLTPGPQNAQLLPPKSFLIPSNISTRPETSKSSPLRSQTPPPFLRHPDLSQSTPLMEIPQNAPFLPFHLLQTPHRSPVDPPKAPRLPSCPAFITGLWVLSNSFVHRLLCRSSHIRTVIIAAVSLFLFSLSQEILSPLMNSSSFSLVLSPNPLGAGGNKSCVVPSCCCVTAPQPLGSLPPSMNRTWSLHGAGLVPNASHSHQIPKCSSLNPKILPYPLKYLHTP